MNKSDLSNNSLSSSFSDPLTIAKNPVIPSKRNMPNNVQLVKEILELKQEKNAVILAHNYQIPEVQDIADFTGDSLGLSLEAAKTTADLIVFCGVYFMAETAAILSPEKRVLIPDKNAGCSLASSITAQQLRSWKSEHPNSIVVSYVNTTAAVKAESDYCCTSTNAVKIVESIPEKHQILFLPDMFLGTYVQKITGRKNILVWWGECHVHAAIGSKEISKARHNHPKAKFLIHPECGCINSAMYLTSEKDPSTTNGKILSTGNMEKYVRESQSTEFVVATENGMLHPLRKKNPGKTFYPISDQSVCEFMKMTNLEKLRNSLRENIFEVKVPERIAKQARIPLERMLAIK